MGSSVCEGTIGTLRSTTAFEYSGAYATLTFCERRGINLHSFRRRYRRSPQFSGKRRKSAQKAFTELTPPLSPPRGGLVVWVGESVRIECPSGMSLEAVAALARGLTHDG